MPWRDTVPATGRANAPSPRHHRRGHAVVGGRAVRRRWHRRREQAVKDDVVGGRADAWSSETSQPRAGREGRRRRPRAGRRAVARRHHRREHAVKDAVAAIAAPTGRRSALETSPPRQRREGQRRPGRADAWSPETSRRRAGAGRRVVAGDITACEHARRDAVAAMGRARARRYHRREHAVKDAVAAIAAHGPTLRAGDIAAATAP